MNEPSPHQVTAHRKTFGECLNDLRWAIAIARQYGRGYEVAGHVPSIEEHASRIAGLDTILLNFEVLGRYWPDVQKTIKRLEWGDRGR